MTTVTSLIDDPTFHRSLSRLVIVLAPIVFVFLLVAKPPTYGKLANNHRNLFGPSLPAKWCWMIFESPNWIISIVLWTRNPPKNWPNRLLLGWFVLHYLHRSIWYPSKMSTKSKFPIGIMLMAAPYCIVNGYLQAQDLCRFQTFSTSHVTSPNFVIGSMLTVCGFAIAYHSDATLVQLKRSTAGTYQIPHGGLFRLVSCPHFLGELLEWTGFCVAADFSQASLSFVVWTAANLLPRAIQQHKWYLATFDKEYKQLGRNAVIPFFL